MMHPSREAWHKYVSGEMTLGDREQHDVHLEQCGECLELYIEAVDLLSEQLPSLREADQLTEQVMLGLPPDVRPAGQPQPSIQRKGIVHHPFFHYAVAAAITMLLMSSGLFQAMLDQTGRMGTGAGDDTVQEEQVSISKQIMDKTIVVLDSIGPKAERGGTR